MNRRGFLAVIAGMVLVSRHKKSEQLPTPGSNPHDEVWVRVVGEALRQSPLVMHRDGQWERLLREALDQQYGRG